MRTLFLFFILTLLLLMTPAAQTLYAANRNNTFGQLQQDRFNATSLLRRNEKINSAELALLKANLKGFTTVLEQKLRAADNNTRMVFTPVNTTVNNVLASPETSISPDDTLYGEIENILTAIEENPVMAMAYEESRNLSKKKIMATIFPDKGPGATYRLNENVQFIIKAFSDCFIQVFFISSHHDTQSPLSLQPLNFYPEPGKKSVYLKSGDSLFLGEDGSFTIEPPYGEDLIIVIATEQKLIPLTAATSYPVTFPLDFGKLFAEIFGSQAAAKLSIHSSFIVSRPTETSD